MYVILDLCRHVELNEATLFRNMYADADPLIVELKGGAANITVSQGEQHQRMRRFHMSLLAPKALQSYRDNIVTCDPTIIGPGTVLDVEPGSTQGPTRQGMRDLINLDRDASWDPDLYGSGHGSGYPCIHAA